MTTRKPRTPSSSKLKFNILAQAPLALTAPKNAPCEAVGKRAVETRDPKYSNCICDKKIL
jgi:hypothetical protein